MTHTKVFSIIIIATSLLIPVFAQSQDRDTMSRADIAKMDSVASATAKADQIQKTSDENRISEAKLDRKQTRAKSKDAKRVEREATSAARESRSALRAERKAQKSRKDATRQAKRAADARAKSEKN